MEAKLVEKVRGSKKWEWRLEGIATSTEKVVLELKIYSKSLNLRKIENKIWQRCTVSRTISIPNKYTNSIKLLKEQREICIVTKGTGIQFSESEQNL